MSASPTAPPTIAGPAAGGEQGGGGGDRRSHARGAETRRTSGTYVDRPFSLQVTGDAPVRQTRVHGARCHDHQQLWTGRSLSATTTREVDDGGGFGRAQRETGHRTYPQPMSNFAHPRSAVDQPYQHDQNEQRHQGQCHPGARHAVHRPSRCRRASGGPPEFPLPSTASIATARP